MRLRNVMMIGLVACGALFMASRQSDFDVERRSNRDAGWDAGQSRSCNAGEDGWRDRQIHKTRRRVTCRPGTR